MSTTIDQRVVEMQFDNRDFERNVATTSSTLAKFKQNLKLDGATKGLQEVDAASRKLDFAPIGTALDTVRVKFSGWQVAAVTALQRVTNAAITTGKRMISALTIDPIKTGFNEYETKMGAIQTIMSNTASKGTTMQDVTRVIGELNTYADKTIYNFAEMTKNIGTFTAAGVGLEEAASAIQGIANLAAASGSTSQQASTAMYQLSQALSSGTVKLMDWNSVVNAGMGGEKFQEALKATARDHGVAVDKMIKKAGSFRESLSQGWITADILNETLNKFTVDGAKNYAQSMMDAGKWTQEQADALIKEAQSMEDAATKVKTFTQLWDTLKESAQSGWANTWEIVVGDFEEAKATLTEISDVIGGMLGKSADERNDLLMGGLSTGWKQLLSEGIDDAAGFQEMVTNVAKEHGVKLDEMINDETTFQDTLKEGWLTGEMLEESVTKFTDKLSGMSEEELKAAGYTQENVDKMKELCKKFKEGELSAEEFAKRIGRPSGRQNIIDALWNAFNGLLSVLKPVKDAFREIFPPTTAEQLYNLTTTILEFSKKLTLSDTASKNLKRTFAGLFAILDIGWQVIKAAVQALAPLFGATDDICGSILETTAAWGDWMVALNDGIKNAGIFATAVEWIHNAFDKVREVCAPVVEGVKALGDAISSAFTSSISTLSARLSPLASLGEFIKITFQGMADMMKKVAPIVYSLTTGIIKVTTDLFNKIGAAFQNADYDALFDFANAGIFTTIGVFIAKFMKNMSSATDVLKTGGDFLKSLSKSITGIFSSLEDASKSLTENVKAKTLKDIAIAIGILAVSLLIIASIDSEKLAASLFAITNLFGSLIGAVAALTNIVKGKQAGSMMLIAGSLIGLGIAIMFMAVALKILSTIPVGSMTQSLLGLAGGIGTLIVAVKLMGNKNVAKSAASMLILSAALIPLAGALKLLSMLSWEELAKGLIGMVVGLAAMVAAVKLMPMDAPIKAAGALVLALSLLPLAGALKILASMGWEQIARSLSAMGGALLLLSGAMFVMSKAGGLGGSAGFLMAAVALIPFAYAMKLLGELSWEEIGKCIVTLAGALLFLAGGMFLMQYGIGGAFALIVMSGALLVFIPVLKQLAGLDMEEIGHALLVIAAVFGGLGVAALVLSAAAPVILALCVSLALLGAACVLAGAGIMLFATGLMTLAGAGAGVGTAITVIISSIAATIPMIADQLGRAIIVILERIGGAGEALCKAVGTIIVALCDALIASVPKLTETVFIVVTSLLQQMVQYVPPIVNALFDLLIAVIDSLAEKTPDLIKSVTNLIMQILIGAIDAMKSMDPNILVTGIQAVGFLTVLMTALAYISAIAPFAIVGAISAGLVIAELALVVAALGAMAEKIPGLIGLVSSGGDLLQVVGTAIGQFIGGLVGGFGAGVSAMLPQIGTDLSTFMSEADTFIKGAKGIDATAMAGVQTLVGIIFALTGAGLLDSLTSWLTGGDSMTKFGEQIAAFGPYIKAYSDAVDGIKPVAVLMSAQAAEALARMAHTIPNQGGVAAWFAGENSIATFGNELVLLGSGLLNYSRAVSGIDCEAIIASAKAAEALTAMADTIPNQGGVAAWFAGDNSIAQFGDELVKLGSGLLQFSQAATGINCEAVINAAKAAEALTAMADTVPNEGGVVAWFAGENSIAKFGDDLIKLGHGLLEFSESVVGVDCNSVMAAANAAKALTSMADTIPNAGGVVAWFAGENSIAAFSTNLGDLGGGIAAFGTAVKDVKPDEVTAAAQAAKAIAEMANTIPNEGGVAAWFAGENSIASFAGNLGDLGAGIAAFGTAVEKVKPDKITAAAQAAKTIAQMADTIPNSGGVASWFAGENSMAAFAGNLGKLGDGIAAFSVAVKNIAPDKVTAAAKAAKTIAQMAKEAPSKTDKLISFGTNLEQLGPKLTAFMTSTATLTVEAANRVKTFITTIVEATKGVNSNGIKNIGTAIDSTVTAMSKVSSIEATSVDGFTKALDKLANSSIKDVLSAFKDAGKELKGAGEALATKLADGIKSKKSQIKANGKLLIDELVNGLESADKVSKAKKACTSLISKCSKTIRNKKGDFKSAGVACVDGFAEGITSRTWKAEAKAKAMASAAVKAAKRELDVNSPSKVFRALGYSVPEGFAMGIDKMANMVTNSSVNMAKNAIENVKQSISNIARVVNSDIDAEPTIRPVLDLSSVRSGAAALNGMLAMEGSVGMRANVSGISAMMNNRLQNGVNAEVVSAINKLRKDLGNLGSTTYQINGVTYDDGSNISEAVKSIVRAARIERRV